MNITTKQTKQVEEDIVTDILCNKCGKSCKDDCDMNYEGLLGAYVNGGYAAKLGDMVSYEFSLCEDCLFELMKTFKLSAKRDDHSPGGNCTLGIL